MARDEISPLEIPPAPDYEPNALSRGSPSYADAMDELLYQYRAAQERDRFRQIQLGNTDPETGKRTAKGLKDDAQNLLMGFGPSDIGLAGGLVGAIKRVPRPGIGSEIRPPVPEVPNLLASPEARAAIPPPEGMPAPLAEGTAAAPLEAPGQPDRVSTRTPNAAKQGFDPHDSPDHLIGIDAARASDPAYARNAEKLTDTDPKTGFPDLPVGRLRNPDRISMAMVNHLADNLVWLHGKLAEKLGPEFMQRASMWYDGANKIATDLGQQFGYTTRQVAAAMAALSPQKHWFQNVDQVKRVINFERDKQGQVGTPQMETWSRGWIADKLAEAQKNLREAVKPSEIRAAEQQLAAIPILEDRVTNMMNGRPYSSINSTEQKAFFLRAHDEAHNNRGYLNVTPEGGFGQFSRNPNGELSRSGWGSLEEIEKAITALNTNDLRLISRMLGEQHKVRSFYNNIVSPNSRFADATMDTHAIAAAHLRPLGGTHPVVTMGLGGTGSSSRATGSKGTYGLYHEAYRLAAERISQMTGQELLPRQLQSITWEGIRSLFTPAQKRNSAFRQRNSDILKGARDGLYSMDEARQFLFNHALPHNEMPIPSWLSE